MPSNAGKAIGKKTAGPKGSMANRAVAAKKVKGGTKQSTGRVTKKTPVATKRGSGNGRKPGTH
jgi:hypothetical protein